MTRDRPYLHVCRLSHCHRTFKVPFVDGNLDHLPERRLAVTRYLRIFPHQWGNSCTPTQRQLKCDETLVFQAPLAVCWRASFLQPCNPEHHLRSALVVAIALTLAVGPNASLLCRIVCNPQAAAASGCHHQAPTTSSSMAAADGCAYVSLSSAAFLREDIRGDGSSSGEDAVPVLRYQAPDSLTIACCARISGFRREPRSAGQVPRVAEHARSAPARGTRTAKRSRAAQQPLHGSRAAVHGGSQAAHVHGAGHHWQSESEFDVWPELPLQAPRGAQHGVVDCGARARNTPPETRGWCLSDSANCGHAFR